ncbi:ATP-binding protein [Ensifer canadensis]
MRLSGSGVRTIRGRIMLVTIVAVMSVIFTGRLLEQFATFDHDDVVDVDLIGQRALTLAYLVRDLSAEERQRIIERSAEVGIDIEIMHRDRLRTLPAPADFRSALGTLLAFLFPPDQALPDGSKILMIDQRPVLSVPVDGDEILLYKTFPDTVFTTEFTGALLYYFLSFVTLGIFFSIFAVTFITAPLKSIALKLRSTDAFLAQSQPLEETGSAEIVDLARALNEMRSRVREMMQSRTRMLRSVSHDLRTPLTRVRLRAECIEDSAIRAQILSDILQINAMIHVTLEYLRDDRGNEILARTDIASILQTIVADFSDVGAAISYNGPAKLVGFCKPTAIARAVANLCENGLKYGTEVQISLCAGAGGACIEVRDDGPGIPQEYRQRVLEPFFMMDGARTRRSQPSGFGLGLSIVDEIVRDHRGTIVFGENEPRGLTVQIVLPIGPN